MKKEKKAKILLIINSKILLFIIFYSHFFSIPFLYGDREYNKKYERIFFRKKRNHSYNKKNSFHMINNSIIEKAKDYMYTPYKYGGNTKNGIDCSAFIKKVFASHKISLPRITSNQAKKGYFVPKKSLEKGDLLFFSTGASKRKINHVGMVIHVDTHNIFFIHASTSNGVTISPFYQKYWNNRFITARRILYSS
ncbi:C40 family peptidase [Blattabacterium cuenoti]|uniref:C40 family peptidase n=1 Tax=Blattabacterium cuenoti TaxID=1653831 RepID=UPI001EEE54D0|nr:NlpC/P60 family protein [Blattabacterium cuenoti]